MANISLGQASTPAVNQYLALARTQNLPIEELLQDLSIDPILLSDNSQFIPGEKFQELLSKLINLSHDDLFGLHTAPFVQPVSYSVLGFMCMNCETLGEAIKKIQPFEKLVGDMGTTTTFEHDQLYQIGWCCHFTDHLVKRHMIDNCLGSWLTFARYLVDENCDPVKVWLSRDKPEIQQQAQYKELFKCPVLFNQSSNSIFFEGKLLEHPLTKGDKLLLAPLESHAKLQLQHLSIEQDIVMQIQMLIKQQLKSGNFHLNTIAKLLGVSKKTIQRRLLAASTGFQTVLDKIRLEVAYDFLKNTSLNLNQISLELGFRETRSFYRWFLKLTHQTPGQYRLLENNS